MVSICCLSITKGITGILIICQLYSFVMGKQDVLTRFVLQAVDYVACTYKQTAKHL